MTLMLQLLQVWGPVVSIHQRGEREGEGRGGGGVSMGLRSLQANSCGAHGRLTNLTLHKCCNYHGPSCGRETLHVAPRG